MFPCEYVLLSLVQDFRKISITKLRNELFCFAKNKPERNRESYSLSHSLTLYFIKISIKITWKKIRDFSNIVTRLHAITTIIEKETNILITYD